MLTCMNVLVAAHARVLADCVFYRCRSLRGRWNYFLCPYVRHDPAVGDRQDQEDSVHRNYRDHTEIIKHVINPRGRHRQVQIYACM